MASGVERSVEESCNLLAPSSRPARHLRAPARPLSSASFSFLYLISPIHHRSVISLGLSSLVLTDFA